MHLIIVESPTKANTLSRFLGKDYVITSTMGHIRDLPKDKLGVDIEHDFEPQYVTVKERREQVKKLKEQVKTASSVYLATDPDREGEAIAWHVAEAILPKGKIKDGSVSRIVFHEITDRAIHDAIAHPRTIDMQMVNAQQARRVLDRLVGYKLSPLLWYKVRKGLSAGRVQSVAVRLIVDREREIEAFKPVEYWIIEADFQKIEGTEKGATFTAKLVEFKEKKLVISHQVDSDKILDELKHSSYVVKTVKTKQVKRSPWPPFTTSTMQQSASNRYGWTAKKTMQLAQQLYEEGYITYHRTDSTNIAVEAIEKTRQFIRDIWGDSFLPELARVYKTKSKVAQEAHEAIRPTDSSRLAMQDYKKDQARFEHSSVQQLPERLGRDAERLYSLIWKRFVACQMKEAVYDQTSVDVGAGDYMFRASGSVVVFIGWQTLFRVDAKKDAQADQEEAEDDDEEHFLPPLTEGEPLTLAALKPQQKFTEPPPRFNEASLIKALEEKGIGRPSTYAPTISTILLRQYVEKQERRFLPTPLGLAVNDFLVQHFPNIVDFDFTAKLEDQLDDIANGTVAWSPAVREFFTPFNDRISAVYKEAKRVRIETEEIDEICPECGNALVVRIGKYGKFIACSTYPTCKYTRQYVEKTDLKCPQCGGEIIVRKTKRGKQFYGCSNYPKCTFAAWKKEQIGKPAAKS